MKKGNQQKYNLFTLFAKTYKLNLFLLTFIELLTFFIIYKLLNFYNQHNYLFENENLITYIHIPFAWLNLTSCIFIITINTLLLISNHPFFIILSKTITYLTISLTSITLITGLFWTYSTWYNTWGLLSDIQFSTLFFLLLLCINNLILLSKTKNSQLTASFTLFGIICILGTKYSTVWWNNLHQEIFSFDKEILGFLGENLNMFPMILLYITLFFNYFLILTYSFRTNIIQFKEV